MENLPIDILRSILYRLPVETILPCKRVCKIWRTVISNKVGLLFASTCTSNNFACSRCIWNNFDCSRCTSKDVQLHYGDDHQIAYGTNEINHDLTKTLTKLDPGKLTILPCWFGRCMVGSCNGLVCFRPVQNPVKHVAFISNPMTGESICVPGFRKQQSEPTLCGFGYVCSTNEYKVVGLYMGCVCVYTLERLSSKWRRTRIGKKKRRKDWKVKEKFPGSFLTDDMSCVFANGALHWISAAKPGQKLKIVAFDLADEKFGTVLSPPLVYGYRQNLHPRSHKLLVLGGKLCYVFRDEQLRYLDIWMLKKSMSDDTSYSTPAEDQRGYYYDHTWSWSKFITISWDSIRDQYMPFALTETSIVLLWQNGRHLYTYDPKTSTLKKLWDSYQLGKDVQVIPHMNTSVSLKDLGEAPK